MREKNIENYLRDRVKLFGGRTYKFVSPGNAGVPDRIVMFPGGKIAFVELKGTGRKTTDLQKLQQKRIAKLGFVVVTLDNKADADNFIRGMIKGRMEVMPS